MFVFVHLGPLGERDFVELKKGEGEAEAEGGGGGKSGALAYKKLLLAPWRYCQS
jgi:hypothetical protein